MRISSSYYAQQFSLVCIFWRNDGLLESYKKLEEDILNPYKEIQVPIQSRGGYMDRIASLEISNAAKSA